MMHSEVCCMTAQQRNYEHSMVLLLTDGLSEAAQGDLSEMPCMKSRWDRQCDIRSKAISNPKLFIVSFHTVRVLLTQSLEKQLHSHGICICRICRFVQHNITKQLLDRTDHRCFGGRLCRGNANRTDSKSKTQFTRGTLQKMRAHAVHVHFVRDNPQCSLTNLDHASDKL